MLCLHPEICHDDDDMSNAPYCSIDLYSAQSIGISPCYTIWPNITQYDRSTSHCDFFFQKDLKINWFERAQF